MKRLLLITCLIFCYSLYTTANNVIVKSIKELQNADKNALPGDTITLQNGDWHDVTIALDCNGTSDKNIFITAQTAGKVIITGNSSLKLGGSFITVEGLLFSHGYSGNNAVIDFRINNKQLANNCRVTNCAIIEFNNPKRMDENYWVSFSGKNNRIDHCSFRGKKNMGVLMAVILDDSRSRENFHSIDHNYFGRRPPLASNSGEIIRVGVSQHCEFNSNTQITDNFFEQCDGETEIISIKSCSNTVRGNLFKESQGGVVLRHGNYNTVENNIFLGNNKEGTGGVRIINKGQWVVNNFFYKCRGVDFRSPLSVMNGIPNSPANRYVQVTDALIVNNTFYNCSPASFCEGSDTERTLPPSNVILANNIFYNNEDKIIYKTFDNINGFRFQNNEASQSINQSLSSGFIKTNFQVQKNNNILVPSSVAKKMTTLPDSIQVIAEGRILHPPSITPGFQDVQMLKKIEANAYHATGAVWFKAGETMAKPLQVYCKTTEEVYDQLAKKEAVIIHLTGPNYSLTTPFVIEKTVYFTQDNKKVIKISTENMMAPFIIGGNGNLYLDNLIIDGTEVKAKHFIASDTSGSSNHYNLSVIHCTIRNLNRENGCSTIFFANKFIVADSIVFRTNNFNNSHSDGIMMKAETDNKGYYDAEKIIVQDNFFSMLDGQLMNIYRGGNDESTMGPLLKFSGNTITDCTLVGNEALIQLYGVQRTFIEKNRFLRCNPNKNLLKFEDAVRAAHNFKNNVISKSGAVIEDKFVENANNHIN